MTWVTPSGRTPRQGHRRFETKAVSHDPTRIPHGGRWHGCRLTEVFDFSVFIYSAPMKQVVTSAGTILIRSQAQPINRGNVPLGTAEFDVSFEARLLQSSSGWGRHLFFGVGALFIGLGLLALVLPASFYTSGSRILPIIFGVGIGSAFVVGGFTAGRRYPDKLLLGDRTLTLVLDGRVVRSISLDTFPFKIQVTTTSDEWPPHFSSEARKGRLVSWTPTVSGLPGGVIAISPIAASALASRLEGLGRKLVTTPLTVGKWHVVAKQYSRSGA